MRDEPLPHPSYMLGSYSSHEQHLGLKRNLTSFLHVPPLMTSDTGIDSEAGEQHYTDDFAAENDSTCKSVPRGVDVGNLGLYRPVRSIHQTKIS